VWVLTQQGMHVMAHMRKLTPNYVAIFSHASHYQLCLLHTQRNKETFEKALLGILLNNLASGLERGDKYLLASYR
jgi:hypothetical protein